MVSVLQYQSCSHVTPHHTRLTSRHVSRHATSHVRCNALDHSQRTLTAFVPTAMERDATAYTVHGDDLDHPAHHRTATDAPPRTGHPHRAGVRSISTFNMHLCSWDARWHRRNRLLTCRNSYHPAARAPSIWRLEVLGRAWAPMMLARRVDGPRVMAAVSQ